MVTKAEKQGGTGPPYPEMARLNKWRLLARSRPLTDNEKRAYGQAVCHEIRALQRSELLSCLAPEKPRTAGCASGCAHNNGPDIWAAIRARHRAELNRQELYTPELQVRWNKEYQKQIDEKRARESSNETNNAA